MASTGKEHNHVLGLPTDSLREHGPEEKQHAMGIPASWIEGPDPEKLRALAHPIRGYRRWARRRRLGIYDTDDS